MSMLLSGCSGDSTSDSSGGDNSGGGNSWENIIDSRKQVEEDGYYSWSWNPEQTVDLDWEFTVRSGPEVEIFLMESTEFDEYQAGNRFYVKNDETGTSGSGTFTVESGNYRFVIDNTDAGNIQPPSNFDDDVAEVEFTVDARPA